MIVCKYNYLEIFNEAFRANYSVNDIYELIVEGDVDEYKKNPYSELD